MDNYNKEDLIERLTEIEERYRSITETSVDAIITSNQNDVILTWNKGAKLMFNYGDEILSSPVTALIPEKYKEAHINGVKRFLKTGKKRIIDKKVELEALKNNGVMFDIELSLSSWKSEKGVHFGAIIRDISGRKKMEEIRENVQRIMRHDIRSPLIGVAGLAGVVLKDGSLTEKQQKSIKLIQELGVKALKFLDRSRDILQIEQGTYTLRKKNINIFELIQQILNELESITSAKVIKTEIRHGADTPESATLYGDEGLLSLMFSNLIKNAVEASPVDESLVITIKRKKRLHYFIIDIHNKGTVPEEIRDSFFEQYVTSGKEGGTGIGTYSAKLIAKTHQGDITFHSSEEDGTHVVVTLPDGK